MNNLWGLVLSFTYIFLVLGLATLYAKRRGGSSEMSRKLIHILVGNWVFLTPVFTELWAVLIVPLTFVIINSLSFKLKLIPAMERDDNGLGTVYYAISMLILSGAAFLLNWPTLSFIGLLTMAYGDGFAAIAGKRFAKRFPFSFSPEKSLLGSLIVAASAFIFTVIFAFVFQAKGNLRVLSPFLIILIALITGVLAAFIELSTRKGCDNLSLPIGCGLSATLFLKFADYGFFIYFFISVVIVIIAFRRQAITADGVVAALLTAQTLYTFGGFWLGVSLIVFFSVGSLVSRLKNQNKSAAEKLQISGGNRNWRQVLSNSLPACVLIWIAYIGTNPLLILAALGIVAAAAADTFSSEFGMLSTGRVFSIINGKPIQRGLSGGITWFGLGAGLIGSALLSVFALPDFGWRGFVFCTILGFLGTLIDSILGALFQAKFSDPDGRISDKQTSPEASIVSGFRVITNNAVNLMTLSIVATIGTIFLCAQV